MRVALVSSGSGSRGGGEIYLGVLAEALQSAGCDVVVLVPRAERMDELAGQLERNVEVIRFAYTTTYDRRLRTLGAWADTAQQRRLAAEFAALRVDVLHLNQQVAEDGLDLVLAAARGRTPWLSTVHIAHSAQSLGAQMGWLRDRLAHSVYRNTKGHLLAVCSDARMELMRRFGSVLEGVHEVPNGVPIPHFNDLAVARQRARQEWGVREGELVVGTVGRIEAQKNPLALIDRLAPFAASGRALRLVWIGDGSMREELCAQAKQVGVAMPLVVDGWRSDASLRLAGLDVFLLPSRFEGLPLALLEAMHAGLPVVASAADGIKDAVQNGRTGFLCRSDAEWHDALALLLEDQDLRLSLGEAARSLAQERFSAQAMANATIAVYETVRAS